MRLPKPKIEHPPEIYAAIVQDHRADPLRMAEVLQRLGWSLADAAWAAANWSLEWIAAAIANEKEKQKIKLHCLSDDTLAMLKASLPAAERLSRSPVARNTPRITSKKPKGK